jgi:serine/threonine protein kinase
MGGEASIQGDVYSCGILVLEMFTGRRPTDEMFKDGPNLHNFVKMALLERLDQIVDPLLLPREVEKTAIATAAAENFLSVVSSIQAKGKSGSVTI